MIMNNTIYPWHQPLLERYLSAMRQQQFPHALLILGIAGSGKSAFAKQLARALLSIESADIIHSDLQYITLTEDIRSHSIDTIRDIIHACQLTAQNSAKVIIIEDAQAMTNAAANALLKTLEQPPGNCYFLLTTHSAYLLPATIVSRCQSCQLPLPNALQLQTWLQPVCQDKQRLDQAMRLSGFSPQLAYELLSTKQIDITQQVIHQFLILSTANWQQICQSWQELPLPWLIDTLLRALFYWVYGLVFRVNQVQLIDGEATACQDVRCFSYWDKLVTIKQWLNANAPLNQVNLLEQLCLDWVALRQ